MSVRVMSLVWESRVGSHVDKAVLLKLADCAADDGSRSYPSIARMAAETEMDEKTVRRSIKRLAETGFISVVSVGHGSRSSEYKINIKKLSEFTNSNRAESPTSTTSMGVVTAPTPGRESYKVDSESGLNRAESPRKPGTVPTSTIIDPLYNHQLTTSYPPPTSPTEFTDQLHPEILTMFEEIFAIWPAKRKKPAARMAYAQARKRGVAHETMVSAARRFGKYHYAEKTKEQFIQSLGDWIESDGWTATNGKTNRKPVI